jgi:hypothetical protein
MALDRRLARLEAQRDGKQKPETEPLRAMQARVLAALRRKHGCEDDD